MPRNCSQKKLRLLASSAMSWRSSDPDHEIAVLMSGGVDSTVTAMLLQQAGWRVVGVTMKIPVMGDTAPERQFCGLEAARAAAELGAPHYFVEIAETFRECVVGPFREAYTRGLTPNPCVDCNAGLKFGAVWDLIEEELGVRHLATGHYARISRRGEYVCLEPARDEGKDQSYFIYRIPRERLPFFHLPLGELRKDEVRRLAAAAGLTAAQKSDSSELCFAGGENYRAVLGVSGQAPGPILDIEGREIGRHTGIWNYTVGQRRGLRAPGPEPYYVVGIMPEKNTVIAGPRRATMHQHVRAIRPHVLQPDCYRVGGRLTGKLRSYMHPAPCVLTVAGPDAMEVVFDAPQFAPAPGQHLVVYAPDRGVVAGGEIRNRLSE